MKKTPQANGFEIKVEKGIALPRARGRSSGIIETIRAMKVGDSFLWPAEKHLADIWPMAKRAGVKLTSRRQPDGTVRIWCVTAATK